MSSNKHSKLLEYSEICGMEEIYGEMVIQYKNTNVHFPICVCKKAQHKKKKYICMQQKIDYQKP